MVKERSGTKENHTRKKATKDFTFDHKSEESESFFHSVRIDRKDQTWRYRKKSFEKSHIGNVGRGKRFEESLVVAKGDKPWEWKISVPENSKKTNLINQKKVIITEKSEIAKSLQSLNSDFYVHNLGGNPFGAVMRDDRDSKGVVKSKKEIVFRQDANFQPFKYPELSKDTEVIVLADDDYLGHYLSQNLAQTLNSNNITIYNVESNLPNVLSKILQKDKSVDKYLHNYDKFKAGSWYVEAQSEIGGTITGVLRNAGSVFDMFTEKIRGKQSYSDFANKYFQSTKGLNITDQELTLMGKVYDQEIKQNIRLKATIKTDSGLQIINANFMNTLNNEKLDVRFKKESEQSLNIKNTDQTVLLLINKLGIQSNQAEQLIQRLSSQDLLTYPRTEYNGISAKENVTTEQLTEAWLKYNPDYADKKDQIVDGINRIRAKKVELPRSGILVLNESNYEPNSIEYRTLQAISQNNILAALGAYELTGKIQLVNKSNKIIDESADDITIISRDRNSVGSVIDVDIQKKAGINDFELFDFMSEKKMNLGTTATRTALKTKLENWGLLLKNNNGEYKLDDRAKIMTLVCKEADKTLVNGEFHKWLLNERKYIEKHSDNYSKESKKLYDKLAFDVKRLMNPSVQRKAINEFNENISRTLIDQKLDQELTGDVVQIVK